MRLRVAGGAQFWHDLTEIVEYAKAGPFELWVIQRAIEGVTFIG